MLQSRENETEILLGNKQLLGIFFVVAILLGVAFTGGYMVGKGSATGKGGAAASETAQGGGSNAGAGETHSVPPESSTDTAATAAQAPAPEPTTSTTAKATGEEPPLGSPQRKTFERTRPAEVAPAAATTSGETFTPQNGQTFLQVAAVERDEAVAVADVLHKKGFAAHAVPKPGSTKIYRVLIGPVADAADLSSTRDALRKTGFREVIVQKY